MTSIRLTDRAKGWGQRRMLRLLRRLLRSNEGASALEFALVGPAFIALLLATFQSGMVFFYQQMLQTATTQESRLIMTGQAQTQNINAATFLQDVCAAAGTMFTCGNMSVNVQTFSSFSNVSSGIGTSPVTGGTFSSTNFGYNPGIAGDIELVQVFYQLPVYTAPLNFNLASTKNGNAVLVGTAVFRNEPYQ
jgi:Flp pilus assembly protein TadG